MWNSLCNRQCFTFLQIILRNMMVIAFHAWNNRLCKLSSTGVQIILIKAAHRPVGGFFKLMRLLTNNIDINLQLYTAVKCQVKRDLQLLLNSKLDEFRTKRQINAKIPNFVAILLLTNVGKKDSRISLWAGIINWRWKHGLKVIHKPVSAKSQWPEAEWIFSHNSLRLFSLFYKLPIRGKIDYDMPKRTSNTTA